jgi:hypothetical protein
MIAVNGPQLTPNRLCGRLARRLDARGRRINVGHVCGRGGRPYAQQDQKACRPEDRPSLARPRSCEDLNLKQLEFPAFAAQLQVCDGAIHRLVLFGTEIGPESDRRSPLSSTPRIARVGCRYDQSEARSGQEVSLLSGGLGSAESGTCCWH